MARYWTARSTKNPLDYAYFLAFLAPPLGILIGIALVARGDDEGAFNVIMVSIVFMFIWIGIFAAASA